MDKNPKVLIIEYIIAICCGILVAVIISACIHPVVISGTSMQPTFNGGELVETINEFTKDDINRGDIIVFRKAGEKKFIKRVVGMPGEDVAIKDGHLYINGIIDDTYAFDDILINNKDAYMNVSLNENEFFCLGDNRNNSIDSRRVGPVEFSEISNIVVKDVSFTGTHKYTRIIQ